MARSPNPPAFLAPWLAWQRFTLDVVALMMDSTAVIGLRTNRVVAAGLHPGRRDRLEAVRMGQEKIAAAAESGAALVLGSLALQQRLFIAGFAQFMAGMPRMLSLAASLTPAQALARQTRIVQSTLAGAAAARRTALEAVPRVAAKGLRPVRSRARANARRLRRG